MLGHYGHNFPAASSSCVLQLVVKLWIRPTPGGSNGKYNDHRKGLDGYLMTKRVEG